MAGMQVAYCLLVYAATVLMVNGALSDLDLALLPQSEFDTAKLIRKISVGDIQWYYYACENMPGHSTVSRAMAVQE